MCQRLPTNQKKFKLSYRPGINEFRIPKTPDQLSLCNTLTHESIRSDHISVLTDISICSDGGPIDSSMVRRFDSPTVR